MNQSGKMTSDTGQVDIRNCRVRRIGAYIEVCMVKLGTPCIYADEHPQALKLCAHPLRNEIRNMDGSLPAQGNSR
jgi:hypothetical protein